MESLGFLLLILCTSILWGYRILRRLIPLGEDAGEIFLLSLSLGLGIIAYSTFIIGIMRLLYPGVFYILILISLLLNYKLLREIGMRLRAGWQTFVFQRMDAVEKGVLILLFLYLVLTLLGAMAPPTSWDAGTAHLALPRIFASEHRVRIIPEQAYSIQPLLIHMLYTLGIVLQGDILAKLFHWVMSVLLLFAIFVFGTRYFSRKIALVSAAVFYSMPITASQATGALIDISFSLYSFLALFLLFHWRERKDLRLLILSAVMAGFSNGIRHTGILYTIFLLGFLALQILEEKRKGERIPWGWVPFYGGLAFILASPWYFRSFSLTGNPVYPLFNSVLGIRSIGPPLPFLFKKGIFPFGNGEWRNSFGPLYLVFLPLLFLQGKKVDVKIKYLLVFSLSGLLILYLKVADIRYLLPFIVPLSLAVAYSWQTLRGVRFSLHRLATFILLMVLVVNCLYFVLFNSLRFPVVFGLQSRDQYLSRRIKIYDVAQYANNHLRDKDKVLILDPRGYYLKVKYVQGVQDPVLQFNLDFSSFRNKDEVFRELKRRNITHILFDPEYLHKVQRWYGTLFEPLNEGDPQYLHEVYQKNGVYIYKAVFPFEKGKIEMGKR